MESSKILSCIRSLMSSYSPPLDALLVPTEDYHQSEYVSSRDKRREFVSGFTGSAGLALITMDGARLWTDGRYFLQAQQELSRDWTLMRMGEDPQVEIWVAYNLREEASIGVDPWCISIDDAHRYKHAFNKKRQILVETCRNLVDEVWENRPPPEANPIFKHPLEFSGCSVTKKLTNLRTKLKENNTSSIIITTLDDVAWLYNIRGNDVAYNPVVHSFAIITLNTAFMYVDNKKASDEIKTYFMENGVTLKEYEDIRSDITLLASNRLKDSLNESKYDVWVDPSACCFGLYTKLNHEKVLLQPSPVPLAKAIKNPVELEGLKRAHIRDGAAVVQFLVWLDNKMQETYGASGYFVDEQSTKKQRKDMTLKLTEVSVSDKLEAFRATKEHFRGLSFPTISSVGPNAAIIHYTPQADTCAELDPDKIYLFDSGAQYLDGTTDITRAVHFGKPTPHERACYTAVLKGHIALGNSIFPNGTNGHTLDVLARVPLWENGLDYRHGTGHGVGSYLYVHEGPHLISLRPQPRVVPLQASMTVTDEPGYYEDGNFGVRLENVLVIKNAETTYNFSNKGYLCFEHMTWAPYQTKMIDVAMLLPSDVEWINDYHGKCREILLPFLDESERDWLIRATDLIAAVC